MNTRVHVSIYGDVIGVGFRYWIFHQAKQLRLTGWVKNVSREYVEAVFEGEEGSVKKMIGLCKKGPEVAWVEKVDMREEKPTGEFVGFEVRY